MSTPFFRRVILFGLLGALLNDGTAALGAEKIRIAYGYRSNTVLPLWTANDANYFQKHGLDVEIINVRGSAIGIAGLVSGDFNYFVMGATSPVGAAGQGMDIVTPMTMTTPNFVLIGRPEIRQPSDLKGKTVAMGEQRRFLTRPHRTEPVEDRDRRRRRIAQSRCMNTISI